MADSADLCEKCEERPAEVTCSCDARFCERCVPKHLGRNPRHKRGGTRKADEAWNWITGKLANMASLATQFQEDEAAKWFGLFTETTLRHDRITSIVETPRLRDLMAQSTHHSVRGPRRQFPSITSFVGETGAGKSTLIRSLIYHSEKAKRFNPLEAPVPGAASGSSAILSTTGEVNLYLDPTTFGTEAPTFYADCEGMLGTEPVASQHQSEWARYGRRHPIAAHGGKHMDRRTAVQTLYPRFLYIFSDVICYVTRNHRAWADSALRLLEWSMVGAQSTINQHALPALIIIINGPTLENESWVSGDPNRATKDFFMAIEKEIRENSTIRNLARKHGDTSMRALFCRSFASVHVHYVPLEGYKSLGTTATVIEQTARLARRIRNDSERVQMAKAKSWTKFDTRQICLLIDYAFEHLASGKTEPLDFGQCRQHMSFPDSTEEHLSEVFGYCLQGRTDIKFEVTGKALASSLLRHAISEAKEDLVLLPNVVFNQDIEALCSRAVTNFLEQNVQCAFVDPENRQQCVNTKIGHALGHQNSLGRLLKPGLFVSNDFDTQGFLTTVETAVHAIMLDINAKAPSGRKEWRRHAAEAHRRNLAELRAVNGFPRWSGDTIVQDIASTSVCYGCFFGRPEYRLPCGHVICAPCIEDFDETPNQQYPGAFIHKSCIICSATGDNWPYKVRVKPDLAGVRVLSLDGGGVRGIVELVVLERLEKLVGLGLPLGQLFDLMVGTSAGGIIALGLGVQNHPVEACIDRFRTFINAGFKPKPMTKAKGLGLIARWFRSSIYRSEPLENGLQNAFSPDQFQEFYGLQRPCRVAVTTTSGASGADLKLIANYNRGGKEKYLNSQLAVWHAARCTSAAPMFFEHTSHSGYDCRDGGLKANNPVQHAVNECKEIWGTRTNFDLLLSVGPGQADKPQKQPSSWYVVPPWLTNLLSTLLSTMDGGDAWRSFSQSAEKRILDRATRLNVKLDDSSEPALDDIKSVKKMESAAQKYRFYHSRRPWAASFVPIQKHAPDDLLQYLAVQLRASMFFFEMEYMENKTGVAVFRGWICCRLGPGEAGFKALMDQTRGFVVAGQPHKMSELWGGGSQPFKPSVLIRESNQNLDRAIRIDVDFGSGYTITISGFPMTLKALLDYGNEHFDNLQSSMDQPQPQVKPAGVETIGKSDSDFGARSRQRPAVSVSVTVLGGT